MAANLLLFFIAGLIQDLLWTLNVSAVSERKTFRATTYSFINTVFSMMVLYTILEQVGPDKGLIVIIAYALGVGMGTLIGMEYKELGRYFKRRVLERKTIMHELL